MINIERECGQEVVVNKQCSIMGGPHQSAQQWFHGQFHKEVVSCEKVVYVMRVNWVATYYM